MNIQSWLLLDGKSNDGQGPEKNTFSTSTTTLTKEHFQQKSKNNFQFVYCIPVNFYEVAQELFV
jgi:hypothetical protein